MHVYDREAADTRQGYRATSMNEIARHSGGSRANLYLHFRNKPDIVLARMRDLEPTFAAPFTALFDEPPATHTQALGWLATMKNLWLEGRVEFSAIEQAMADDEEVATEWWSMVQRVAHSMPELTGNPTRRMHFITLWMGLDRTFQFVYGRGHAQHEDQMLDSLAWQWLALFHQPGR